MPVKVSKEISLSNLCVAAIPAKIAEVRVSATGAKGIRRARMPGEKRVAMGAASMFDVDVDLKEMGRRMDQARIDAGMSIFEVVVATEINETLVRKYLKGQTEPGATKVARIAEVLGVSADWLLQNTDNPKPAESPWKPGDPERRATPPASGGAPLEEMEPQKPQPKRRRSA